MVRLQVKELAEAQGLNLNRLQLKSQVSMGVVRRYWYNRSNDKPLENVSLDCLHKIAHALGVHVGELFVDEDEDTHEVAA